MPSGAGPGDVAAFGFVGRKEDESDTGATAAVAF
jgi:hypothetical protein